MNAATGSTCDISPLLHFYFWRSVYFNSDDSKFPSTSTEEAVRFVSISEIAGYGMTFYILNVVTNEFISRSNTKLSGESNSPNLRVDPLTTPEVVKYLHCENDDANLPSATLEDNNKPHTAKECASYDNSTSTSKQIMPIMCIITFWR